MDPNDAVIGLSSNNWWLVGKRCLIHNLLKRHCPPNANILNVGSGMGEDLPTILPFGHLTALDCSLNAVNSVKKRFPRVPTIKCLIENVQFKNKFDVVLAFDVLEHIRNDDAAVQSIWKLLKPGGLFIGIVPAWPLLGSPHDKALGHYRRYTPKMLRKLLKKFELKSLCFWNFTLSPMITCLRIAQKIFPFKLSPANVPGFANFWLGHLLKAEAPFSAKGISPPYGISLVFVSTCPKNH